MTGDEIVKKYNIPENIIQEYAAMGLCSELCRVMENWKFNDTDLERMSLIMTLHEMGFDNDEVSCYMNHVLNGDLENRCMKMLTEKRNRTLDEIHFKEKQLDTMDYLRHEINNKEK